MISQYNFSIFFDKEDSKNIKPKYLKLIFYLKNNLKKDGEQIEESALEQLWTL